VGTDGAKGSSQAPTQANGLLRPARNPPTETLALVVRLSCRRLAPGQVWLMPVMELTRLLSGLPKLLYSGSPRELGR
jgi:hypothetical protein